MDQSETDFVVVGAGTAGCVVAARLSENPARRVLLIEAGVPDRNVWIQVPLGVGKLLTNTRYVWPFTTEPEPELHGQRIYTPRGKVLGGTSAINGMGWVRGDPAEFDRWRDELGLAAPADDAASTASDEMSHGQQIEDASRNLLVAVGKRGRNEEHPEMRRLDLRLERRDQFHEILVEPLLPAHGGRPLHLNGLAATG